VLAPTEEETRVTSTPPPPGTAGPPAGAAIPDAAIPGETIGVVGLGSMGGAVALRLAAVGCRLVVFDLAPAAVQRLVAAGASAAASPREVAGQADVVLTILPNGPDVERAAGGDDGLLAGARPGQLWIEMSTIDPAVTRRLAEQAALAGVRVIDAAIGGLTTHAPSGDLVLMVGAADAELARARPVLALLARTIHHCGPVGAGVTMKLVNNLLAGVAYAATCEALLLGRRAGLGLETMLDVLSTTMADNAHLRRTVAAKVIPRAFAPGFRLALQRKDAHLALELGGSLGVPLPLGAVAQQLRSIGLSQGLADHDSSALIGVLECLAGIDVRTGQPLDG
jgi:3-hydroxyisobutyrate dehydrogenase-like beta-hydroxyacid dehydrogenase